MKKFLKKTEGFTLVELIVVIAILGILTAIAVPTYSGYVKKAGEAADTQTLSAVNTAIAAAMTENDKEMSTASTYLSFEVESEATAKAGCTVTVEAGAGEGAAAVLADFVTYYGYDEDAGIAFDYYEGVRYATASDNASLGNLVGTEG